MRDVFAAGNVLHILPCISTQLQTSGILTCSNYATFLVHLEEVWRERAFTVQFLHEHQHTDLHKPPEYDICITWTVKDPRDL